MKKSDERPVRHPAFVLTSEEKRIIGFVLTAFLLGLCAKQHRKAQPEPAIVDAIKQSAAVVGDATPKRSKQKPRAP
jgi:hypothetical protein